MAALATIVVDFDGTVCSHDVGVHLLERFGSAAARDELSRLDAAFGAGTVTLRTLMEAEAASLVGSREELLAFALDHCPLDPTFGGFASWARDEGIRLTIVSDGFGFHVRPMLAASGLGDLSVLTNDLASGRLTFGGPHPICVGCGTCKKQAVERHRATGGGVAFVGDGVSDRFGARYADVTFAKHTLADHCRLEGIPFIPFGDFDDVRGALETMADLPGPVGGEPCPGWTEPG